MDDRQQRGENNSPNRRPDDGQEKAAPDTAPGRPVPPRQ